jgi:hypothetical protein
MNFSLLTITEGIYVASEFYKAIKDCQYKVSHLSRKERGEDGAPDSVIR